MTACRRCASPLHGRDDHVVTLRESRESTGTAIDVELCRECWNRLRDDLLGGRVRA
jgi:hypothetical protein